MPLAVRFACSVFAASVHEDADQVSASQCLILQGFLDLCFTVQWLFNSSKRYVFFCIFKVFGSPYVA